MDKMRQHYDRYTAEDQQTWRLLFERQIDNLQDKACGEVLECLEEMKAVMRPDAIPRFEELDQLLLAKTGWSIEVVAGLIPADEFFALLAQKRFCSSTWLRSLAQLDYLEEPDMFHDIFGHIPLLMNPAYADFIQRIGQLGVEFAAFPEAVAMLEKLYWFTIEFGLVREKEGLRIYGAGILSSFLEAKEVMGTGVTVKPFNLQDVMFREFRKDELQGLYVEVESMETLFGELDEVEAQLKQRFQLVMA